MRQKSFFPGVLLLALLFSLLAGCGGGIPGGLDAEALTTALLGSGAFSDLLSPVDADVAGLLYGYAAVDVSSVSVYCGTGATAEEIAVFKAVDPAAADRLKEAAEQRIKEQKRPLRTTRLRRFRSWTMPTSVRTACSWSWSSPPTRKQPAIS